MVTLFKNRETGYKALKEIKRSMEKKQVTLQIKEISHQIQTAHASGDNMMTLALLRRKTELEKEMHGANQIFDKSNI
jgi:superfamily I DNA and/or RNA helicase